MNFFKEKQIVFSWHRIWVVVAAAIVFIGIIFTGLIAYSSAYQDRVLPGVFVGNIPVGGMDRDSLITLFEMMSDKLVSEGMNFSFDTNNGPESFVIYPVVVADGNSSELIDIDIGAAVGVLLDYGKNSDTLTRALVAIMSRVRRPHLSLVDQIIVDKNRMMGAISDQIFKYESEPANSSINIISVSPLKYEYVSSSPGAVFSYENVMGRIISDWASLESVDLKIDRETKEPAVVLADVLVIENRLGAVVNAGSLQLTYTDPYTRKEYLWTLSMEDLARWTQVQKISEDKFGFGLDEKLLVSYLKETIEPKVDMEAKDAKFEIGDDGNAAEFQGSRPGVKVNIEKSYLAINEAFLQRTWHDEVVSKGVQIVVDIVEPNIKTGEVNNLGISEILGVGISDYSNSPYNRKRNIKNAVEKLNGVLIKPGEEFSTLRYLRPFTLAGGYYPELVIKGDELKPEIGGGLCQIGTTLFRMAMNSGMPITQRRNHSLVVSHYNDPVNGNPGTDATVYDPNPDFRFVNDTGYYLLLQAYMNTETEELEFTLWGTSDGRKGYYTHPTVSQWFGAGEPVEIETKELAPGERKCQNAFRGANASFTYIREFPDGTKEEREFTSHYRSLPKICLIGVAEKTECQEGDDSCSVDNENNDEEVKDAGAAG
ncbi:MAG: VanW family protein [Patescibacteria group bacterium]